MNEKQIEESLQKFYKNNNINAEKYTENQTEAYIENKNYDPKIAMPSLWERIDCWIDRFSEEDKQYFLKLFEKYVYISEREFQNRIYNICIYIFEEMKKKGIRKEQILFITVPTTKGITSGGDSIRNALIKVNMGWGIDKEKIVSNVFNTDSSMLKEVKAIVFFDDILGTGFSIRNTMESFFEKNLEIDISEYVWGVSGVLMTHSAIRYIKKKFNGDLVVYGTPENYIKSCMKGNYIFNEAEVKNIEKIIEGYESEIGIDEENGKNYIMGFRACKLLLSFYYNTPNNTLCSFWKYTKTNLPLFPRDKYMRPTIEALKNKKRHYVNNAYQMGCVNKK